MPEFTGRLRTPRLSSAPASPVVGEMYYDTTTNILYWWNGTAWISASGGGGAGSDILRYDGAFVAGTYNDGDIVIGSDGVAYLCVVNNTTTAPTSWSGVVGPVGPAGPQGAQGPAGVAGPAGAGIPTVQNNKWIKGSGGAAVWSDISQPDLPSNLRDQALPPLNNDANNATAAGWYRLDSGAINGPDSANYFQLFVMNLYNNQIRQVAWQIGTERSYVRRQDSATWQPWYPTGIIQPDSGWTTMSLGAGYAHYGTPYGPGRYRKLADGMVICEGLIQAPASGMANAAIFTFPVGYRPQLNAGGGRDLIFVTANSATSSYGETFRLNDAGSLRTSAGIGASVWLSLAGLQFYAGISGSVG
jgi:hypothetical protein